MRRAILMDQLITAPEKQVDFNDLRANVLECLEASLFTVDDLTDLWGDAARAGELQQLLTRRFLQEHASRPAAGFATWWYKTGSKLEFKGNISELLSISDLPQECVERAQESARKAEGAPLLRKTTRRKEINFSRFPFSDLPIDDLWKALEVSVNDHWHGMRDALFTLVGKHKVSFHGIAERIHPYTQTVISARGDRVHTIEESVSRAAFIFATLPQEYLKSPLPLESAYRFARHLTFGKASKREIVRILRTFHECGLPESASSKDAGDLLGIIKRNPKLAPHEIRLPALVFARRLKAIAEPPALLGGVSESELEVRLQALTSRKPIAWQTLIPLATSLYTLGWSPPKISRRIAALDLLAHHAPANAKGTFVHQLIEIGHYFKPSLVAPPLSLGTVHKLCRSSISVEVKEAILTDFHNLRLPAKSSITKVTIEYRELLRKHGVSSL